MQTTTPTALRERFESALSIVDQHAEVVSFVGDPDAMQQVADALGDAIDLVAERSALRNTLRMLVERYDALQQTDGAGVYLDFSGTYTAGHWVGTGLSKAIDDARVLLAR